MSVTLVVLAAGLGSRFGGIKQITSVDARGQTLVDYSVYDAVKAGFDRIVFVVTPELETQFRDRIGDQIARHVEVTYAHQSLDKIPTGFAVPIDRTKPWGTGHAVLVALPQIAGSFATINADDFYGADAHQTMAQYLRSPAPEHALVGYRLSATLSSHGTVSRGVCQVADGRLVTITEHTALRPAPGGAIDEAGEFFAGDDLVSLNYWGFRPSARATFASLFETFLTTEKPPSAEFFLPDVAAALAPDVRVLPTTATWLGMTYAADLENVKTHLAQLVAVGTYPERLWA